MVRQAQLSAILFSALLAGCFSEPPPPGPKADPVKESWYGETVTQLAAMDRDAADFFHKKKEDEASALIQKGEELSARLLAVPHPTLAATEAASDLDELYGQMLFSNRNYGWARLLFQRNVARWKNWTPKTEDSAKRLKEAQDEIAECDRRIVQ